jgi:hypothetical protein
LIRQTKSDEGVEFAGQVRAWVSEAPIRTGVIPQELKPYSLSVFCGTDDGWASLRLSFFKMAQRSTFGWSGDRISLTFTGQKASTSCCGVNLAVAGGWVWGSECVFFREL